jgi:hypothetical protein
MSINTDYTPEFITPEPFNHRTDMVLKGGGSIVEDTATNVINTGRNNYVGNFCDGITLLNSSGCTVAENCNNIMLLNSSGISVQAYSSGVVYFNNNLINPSGIKSPVITMPISNYTATIYDDVIICTNPGQEITIPTYSEVGSKRWEVKNLSEGDCYILTNSAKGFDFYNPAVDTITSMDKESYTLQTANINGDDTIIII